MPPKRPPANDAHEPPDDLTSALAGTPFDDNIVYTEAALAEIEEEEYKVTIAPRE